MKKIVFLISTIIAFVTGATAQDKIGEYTYGQSTRLYMYKLSVIDTAQKKIVPALKIEIQATVGDYFGGSDVQNYEFQVLKSDMANAVNLIKKFDKDSKPAELKVGDKFVLRMRIANDEPTIEMELDKDVPELIFSFYKGEFLNLILNMEDIMAKLQ